MAETTGRIRLRTLREVPAPPGESPAPVLSLTELADVVLLPVIATFDQTPDIRTFRLARPSGFVFQAGQFLTVTVRINARKMTRRYSISSAPESADHLEISVKRQGTVSSALHATVGVGSLLPVEPPAGRFVYPAGDPRHVVLIGGGIGCTPLMSMLRHAVVRDPARPVTYLLSVRTEKDVAFRSEISRLRQSHPQIRVGVTLTREQRPGFSAGRIDVELLRRACPDPANSLYYICGPPPMRDGMKSLLSDLGVPAEQVRCEVFDNESAEARDAEPAALRGGVPPPAPEAVDKADSGAREGEAPGSPQVLIFPRKEQVKQVLRFARGEMALHWSIAIPFMICFVTGVTMKLFYNLHSGSLFREVLSFLHRVSGGCLAVFPALAVARNWRDYKVHVYNLKVGFSWTIDDLKWLFLVGPATVSKRIVLPEQRKFNAAERMNFMMVMVTYPLFVATGLILWATGVDHFLPWLLHVSMSLVAPLLMMGHIYMAVVNPSTRVGLSGMITGHVDREWAKHHYTRWYNDHFEEDGTPKNPGPSAR